MNKKLNIQLYLCAVLLCSFVFKVAIADYIKNDANAKNGIEKIVP